MIVKEKNCEQLDFVYDLFNTVKQNCMHYIYRGFFDQNITESILLLAESNIVDKEEKSTVKRRVYHIMVESLQNITRHQSFEKCNTDCTSGIFFIQKKDKRYFVTTGNTIENENITNLKNQLDNVNSYSIEELKEVYKTKLKTGKLSDKGGAGLGLIDMARKSGNKLIYDFKGLDTKSSYFYLHTEIPSTELVEETNIIKKVDNYTLEYITTLHDLLNKHNIAILFNNFFTQESLMNLLSIVESHMTGNTSTRKKIFNIMVEMFQNIVHHGNKQKDTEEGNPGIFFINETTDYYMLNTGNYIQTKKVESLKTKLSYLNSLHVDELDDYYAKTLFDFEIDTKTQAGLGFIDMRIKSCNTIGFDFHKIDNTLTFFALQIKLNKNQIEI